MFARTNPSSRLARSLRTLRLEPLEDRLTPAAGDLHPTFGVGGKLKIPFDLGGFNTDTVNAVAAQTDGKIVVVGTVSRNSSGDYDFAVARLNPDGSLDTTFDADGKRTVAFDLGGSSDDFATAVAITPNGRLILAGDTGVNGFGGGDFAVAQLELAVNRPPTVGADAASTVTGLPVAINVLANDADPDSNPLTVTLLAGPAHGTAVVNPDKTITYTPNPKFTGSDTFTYT